MDISFQQFFQFIQTGGVVGLLLFLTFAFLKRWIVPGWAFDMVVKERDDAVAVVRNAQSNADLAEKIVTRIVPALSSAAAGSPARKPRQGNP